MGQHQIYHQMGQQQQQHVTSNNLDDFSPKHFNNNSNIANNNISNNKVSSSQVWMDGVTTWLQNGDFHFIHMNNFN